MCVRICSVSDTLHRQPSTRRRYDLPGVACLVSSADRCSVSSVRACVPVRLALRGLSWYLPALVLAWSALLPVLCSRSGCAGGWGLHLWGIWGELGVGRSTPRVEKIQKRRFSCLPTPSFLRKSPHPLLSISKIPRKNKKTPTKGLCSVLYLPYKP